RLRFGGIKISFRIEQHLRLFLPDADHLRRFLLERHACQQVLDARGGRNSRVFVFRQLRGGTAGFCRLLHAGGFRIAALSLKSWGSISNVKSPRNGRYSDLSRGFDSSREQTSDWS